MRSFSAIPAEEQRFSGRYDWLRLIVLGTVVMLISAIELRDTIQARPNPGQFPGFAYTFGCGAIALAVVKIAKTRLYVDWLLASVSCIAAGLIVIADSTFASYWSLIMISFLLLFSGVMRHLVGSGLPTPEARWCAYASAWIVLLAELWLIGAWTQGTSIPLSAILALDALFQGLCIAGVGYFLRDAPSGQ